MEARLVHDAGLFRFDAVRQGLPESVCRFCSGSARISFGLAGGRTGPPGA